MKIRLLQRLVGFCIDKFLFIDHWTASKDSIIYGRSEFWVAKSAFDCIYATHSTTGTLREDEMLLINYLKIVSNLLVVVNVEGNYEVQLSDVAFCLRQNQGRDFGAYATGLEYFDRLLPSSRPKLLINSSCKWDIDLLSKHLADLKSSSLVTSMTDSFRAGYHLQTFFLWVPARFQEDIKKFFRIKYRNWRYKRSVVHFGERGLSRYCLEKGIGMQAIYPSERFGGSNFRLKTIYLDERDKLEAFCAPFSKIDH